MGADIRDIDTVRLNETEDAIEIIDQTLLPEKIEVLSLADQHDIWHAIHLLQVRGAPAIGITAGFALYLAAREIAGEMLCDSSGHVTKSRFFKKLTEAKEYLNSSRPTAVNLSWALNRVEAAAKDYCDSLKSCDIDSIKEMIDVMKNEAVEIYEEDIRVCKKIGEHALTLVNKGDGLITHCNAGKLATVRYGTATSVMYLGQEKGYDFKIYCDETRPLLQGARLTAFELAASGMDVTLLCDNMSASLMSTGKINAAFVGCDRVAANGDTANKIGTSMLALAAKRNNVPFYVCAPTSTIDMNTKSGKDIVIEQRGADEVTHMWYKHPVAPDGIKVYNPSFDVTDADLITGIITEKGIIKAPFEKGLKELFK